MTGHSYEQSARMSQAMGPFPGYKDARCSGVDKQVATVLGVQPELAKRQFVAVEIGVEEFHVGPEAIEQLAPRRVGQQWRDRLAAHTSNGRCGMPACL